MKTLPLPRTPWRRFQFGMGVLIAGTGFGVILEKLLQLFMA
ncbi:hypothetical protein [Azovibrio restrictus]|nr:hypothetical protein [Azovibrio restrictus]